MSDRGIQRWLPGTAALALAVAPILLIFAPVLVADRSLAMRDAAHFYHPLLKWTTAEWRNGTPPLWNPYENAGMPLLADGSSGLFYPGRLLLFLPIDFARCYGVYVAGHAVLAALGSYLLARHWQASRPAAACAALAYACGGVVLFQHCNVVYLVGAAWLPFAAWAIDALLSGRSWRAALALGVVLSLMVLGGDPQMAYHVVLIGALDALIRVRSNGEAKPPLFARAKRTCWNLAWVGAAAALGAVLAAVQVLPSLEAAGQSERAYYDRPRNVYQAASIVATDDRALEVRRREIAAGIFGQPTPASHHERLYDFSLAPWRLIECLWPNIGGRMFPTHRRWLSVVPAEGRIWTPSLYFGFASLLFAVSQCRLWRAPPRQAWLSWILLLFTIGSFGWYGLGWWIREAYASLTPGQGEGMQIGSPVGGLYWLMVTLLPGYDSFRYPAKLLTVAAWAASQLSARGFDQARAGESSRLLVCIRALTIASVVLLAACLGAFAWLEWLGPDSAPARHLAELLAAQRDRSLGPFDWRGCQRDVCFALLQTTVVGIAMHWLLRRAGDGLARWPWCLAALVAADLAAANYWLVPTAPAEIWRTTPAAAAAIGSDAANEFPRVFRASLMRWRPAAFGETGHRQRLAQIAKWERDTLFPKYGLPHGISLVESYSSLKSAHHESLLVVAREQGPAGQRHEFPHPSVLQMLGVQYLVVPRQWDVTAMNVPAEQIVPPAGVALPQGAAIWRLEGTLPRARIVSEMDVVPELRTRKTTLLDERTRDVLFPADAASGHRQPRDFENRAVVETDLPLDVPPGERIAGGKCRVIEESLHRVVLEATLAAPGLVVLSDSYAPGWTATVESDGRGSRSVPILRTNRVCRGVLLPAGKHRIEMGYRPRPFAAGAWISGISWCLGIGALSIGLWHRRRANDRQPETALRAAGGGR